MKRGVKPVLRMVKAVCGKLEYCWTESNLATMNRFVLSSTHLSPLTQTILSCSSLLGEFKKHKFLYELAPKLLGLDLGWISPRLFLERSAARVNKFRLCYPLIV